MVNQSVSGEIVLSGSVVITQIYQLVKEREFQVLEETRKYNNESLKVYTNPFRESSH